MGHVGNKLYYYYYYDNYINKYILDQDTFNDTAENNINLNL